MPKIANLSILASFLGLWLTSFLKNETQIIVGFILILSFGIVHGANDLLLIRKIKGENTITYWRILINYITIVLTAVLLFSFIPWLAMFLFIIVSSYHFGEQHWNKKRLYSNPLMIKLFQTIYGLFILLLLFNFHEKEVLDIMHGITGIELSFINILLLLKLIGFILVALSFYNYNTSKVFQKNSAIELLYLLVFAIIFKVGSLIWAFAIYFIFWHSIPSLIDQIEFLYGEVSTTNFKSYLKSAFIYWLISIVGIIVLYFILKEYKIFDSIFFSFLAAITFPHVIVIERMFITRNNKTE
ncbi:Brp/Blh family beta-carotene 15,15'-dioxygenase [Flavobacterium sp.]|uniref:Brp/Blh family beta-carotene 15,15'-dioxygenase n=1 Tax=Flavobacterium sp. TaxID=239 RepID=UPI00286C08BA|nr:Brp/Blh family beta-carotene 15,15'-dioxygenase [Flavobacterium sp.]